MAFSVRGTVLSTLLLTACAAFSAACAGAAELVTLRNGFTLHCSSRESISTDTVRLHLTPEAASLQNYMDVPLASIARIEFAEFAPDAAPSSEVATSAPIAKERDVNGMVQRSGQTHNLNVALLNAVIRAESAGNAHAESRTGARGLMQLMPGTASQLGVTDSFSPEANVNGGSAYLDHLLTRYHENVTLALAAYNAGPAAVDRYHGIPPYRETRLYVAKVIRVWNGLVAAQVLPPAPDRVASR